MEDKNNVTFIIEASSVKLMIEGDKAQKGDEMTKKMKEMNDAGQKLNVIIPVSHLLRGIWTANPDSKIQNLQKILSFCNIAYDLHTDFKDENKTTDELLGLMEAMNMVDEIKKEYPNINEKELFTKMQERRKK